jgi:hypothetical protein
MSRDSITADAIVFAFRFIISASPFSLVEIDSCGYAIVRSIVRIKRVDRA